MSGKGSVSLQRGSDLNQKNPALLLYVENISRDNQHHCMSSTDTQLR